MNQKLKVAIFDLTDCEGCELQFLALRTELLKEGQELEIVNWRLGSSQNHPGPFDVTFIEGGPITEGDVELTKQARAVSHKIVALGACAALGGIQAKISAAARKKEATQKGSKLPRPLHYYIKVDETIPGCPINAVELKKFLIELCHGKKHQEAYFPVCLECKIKKNVCLFQEEGFCLGPVTKGGCGAICPTNGLRCYGCFGPLKGTNFGALKKVGLPEKELKKATELFLSQTEEIGSLKGDKE